MADRNADTDRAPPPDSAVEEDTAPGGGQNSLALLHALHRKVDTLVGLVREQANLALRVEDLEGRLARVERMCPRVGLHDANCERPDG